MSLSEAIKYQNLEESDELPLEIKNKLEAAVMKLCGVNRENQLDWINNCNNSLREIIRIDENIRQLAGDGKIDKAAGLAKQKLDDQFGLDYFYHNKAV